MTCHNCIIKMFIHPIKLLACVLQICIGKTIIEQAKHIVLVLMPARTHSEQPETRIGLTLQNAQGPYASTSIWLCIRMAFRRHGSHMFLANSVVVNMMG